LSQLPTADATDTVSTVSFANPSNPRAAGADPNATGSSVLHRV